jgi:hypothetical protein
MGWSGYAIHAYQAAMREEASQMSLGERTAPSTKSLRGPKFSFTHKKALLV